MKTTEYYKNIIIFLFFLVWETIFNLLLWPLIRKYRRSGRHFEFSSLEDAVFFSCWLKCHEGLLEQDFINFEVSFEQDGKYLMKVRPSDSLCYFLYQEFFDSVEETFDQFRKFCIYREKKYKDNDNRDKSMKHNMKKDCSFSVEAGERCSTVFMCAKTNIPVRGSSATPAISLFSHDGKEIYRKIPDPSMVERDIRPLVMSLNAIDTITTVSSCHGHRLLKGGPLLISVHPPFVSFHTGIDTIYEILNIINNTKLNYRWHIKGYIYNECPQKRPYVLWMIQPKNKWFWRKKLREDIKRLSIVLPVLVMSARNGGAK